MVKFDKAGAAQYVTYFGGSGFDVCTGIALAGDGSFYVASGTTSTNFPMFGSGDANVRRTKTTADRDAFVARFSATGAALIYSGVIGGTGDDQANAIALDSSGRALITGYANAGFPFVSNPSSPRSGMDPFVARVNAGGTALEFSGFLGGNGDAEAGRGIAVASDNSIIVVGETNSTSGLSFTGGAFRTAHGAGDGDGFVARIDEFGTLLNFTVLTGNAGTATGVDRALAVAVDSDGSVLVAGETDSGAFPANNAGAQQGAMPTPGFQGSPSGNMDGFLVRLSPTLRA